MKRFFEEGMIQLTVIMVISWLCIYFIPNDLFFTKYLPLSFSLLYWLVLLAVVGRGWPGGPFARKNPIKAGILTTVTWLVLSFLTTWFITNVWPAVPLFPTANYFGISLFTVSLWYAFIWKSYPFGKWSSGINVLIGMAVTFVLSG